MKLYYAPGSVALAPHIALAESGLAYTTEHIDHREKLCADGSSYLAVNPKGYVPALLLDDGSILTESIAILLYIADQAPAAALAGGTERYRVAEWLTFAATELHQRFMRFPQPGLSDAMAAATDEQLRQRFGHAARQLSLHDYLVGGKLTIADIFLYVAARWLRYRQIEVAAWPSLAAFMGRMEQRPGFRTALSQQGISCD
jgi:glutathione S-transferase